MRQWIRSALVQISAFLPTRHQGIIWTSAGLWSNGPLGTNFSEILRGALIFSLICAWIIMWHHYFSKAYDFIGDIWFLCGCETSKIQSKSTVILGCNMGRWPEPHLRTPFSIISVSMMMSSNGNIFRVTGPSCGEFAGEFPSLSRRYRFLTTTGSCVSEPESPSIYF